MMYHYNNINLSLLTPEDIGDLVIRKHNNNYIIGIVTKSSSFLHKRKRFRPGGLFCEEIFGLLYKCINTNCNKINEFNSNPIYNMLCLNCNRFMNINFKRKYRFGSVFLNFPIINYHYFKNFIELLQIFKIFKKNYFYKNNIFKISKNIIIKNILFDSSIIENKFLNFVNSFYKIIKLMELFKIKLYILNKRKIKTHTILDKFNKFLNYFLSLKNIFLILFPVLPTGFRAYSLDDKRKSPNSELNCIYKCLIDINNNTDITRGFEYNLKNILILHFLIETILDFSKPKNFFKQENDLYDKLNGKYGIFRQNLLGFRVDYSGRSTIVPEPSLSLGNIGLPFNMIRNNAKITLQEEEESEEFYESSMYNNFIYDKLVFFNYFLSDYSTIVNRAPTLHKMNVQTFNPVMVEGESVKFMPLLCSGYNADFDGDQMGIFSILKQNSVNESINMIRSLVNLHSPTTKNNVFNLTQGMSAGYNILSNYNYLKFPDNYISNNYIDLLEYGNRNIFIDSPVLLRSFKLFYYTTCGRLLLNFNFN